MDEVLRLALVLPGEDRLRLAEALWSSVEPTERPFGPEWLDEAERRAARIDSGEGRLSTWDEVRRRARESLQGHTGG